MLRSNPSACQTKGEPQATQPERAAWLFRAPVGGRGVASAAEASPMADAQNLAFQAQRASPRGGRGGCK